MTSSSGRIGSGRILQYIASVLGMHNIHNCKIRASGEVRAKMAMKRCWLNACGRPASRIQNSEYKRSETLQPRYALLFSWMELHNRFL